MRIADYTDDEELDLNSSHLTFVRGDIAETRKQLAYYHLAEYGCYTLALLLAVPIFCWSNVSTGILATGLIVWARCIRAWHATPLLQRLKMTKQYAKFLEIERRRIASLVHRIKAGVA